jgi:hypothetical protein
MLVALTTPAKVCRAGSQRRRRLVPSEQLCSARGKRNAIRVGALAEYLGVDRGYQRASSAARVERGERNASLGLLLIDFSYLRVDLSPVILDAEAHPYDEDGWPTRLGRGEVVQP